MTIIILTTIMPILTIIIEIELVLYIYIYTHMYVCVCIYIYIYKEQEELQPPRITRSPRLYGLTGPQKAAA